MSRWRLFKPSRWRTWPAAGQSVVPEWSAVVETMTAKAGLLQPQRQAHSGPTFARLQHAGRHAGSSDSSLPHHLRIIGTNAMSSVSSSSNSRSSSIACSYSRYCSSSAGGGNSSVDSAAGGGSAPDARVAGRDMAIVFTCTKCETRSAKSFSRASYERGLVLVRCPGCEGLHLIADHLGWFEEAGTTVETMAAQAGAAAKRVDLTAAGGGGGALTAEDVAGWSKVQQLLRATGRLPFDTSTGAAADATSSGQMESAARRGAAGDGNEAVASHPGGDEGVLELTAADLNAWARVLDGSKGSR